MCVNVTVCNLIICVWVPAVFESHNEIHDHNIELATARLTNKDQKKKRKKKKTQE